MKRLAALVALVALAASGCASNDRKLHRALLNERMETMTIITRAELSAQPAGSPARTVLALWRAVQFRDAEGALARVSPQPKPKQLTTFENFIVGIGAQAAAQIKPTVVSADTLGDRAVVVVNAVRNKKVGDQVRRTVQGRVRVELVRSATGWRVLWQKAAPQVVRLVV
jgi:type IV pilus biogenesis protein CpaD/CtpE